MHLAQILAGVNWIAVIAATITAFFLVMMPKIPNEKRNELTIK